MEENVTFSVQWCRYSLCYCRAERQWPEACIAGNASELDLFLGWEASHKEIVTKTVDCGSQPVVDAFLLLMGCTGTLEFGSHSVSSVMLCRCSLAYSKWLLGLSSLALSPIVPLRNIFGLYFKHSMHHFGGRGELKNPTSSITWLLKFIQLLLGKGVTVGAGRKAM